MQTQRTFFKLRSKLNGPPFKYLKFCDIVERYKKFEDLY